MKDILRLWQLQELEREEKALQKGVKSIPEIRVLKQLKEEIEGLQLKVKEKMEERKAVEKKLKGLEDDIAYRKEELNAFNQELYSAADKPAKELEAERIKAESLGEDIKIRENSALILMEQAEALEGEIKIQMKELEEKKNIFREHHAAFQDKKNEYHSRLDEIGQLIAELKSIIAKEDLEEYKELSQRFNDHTGIVIKKNNMCAGCHMALSFDALKKIKEHPIYCDHCGRLVIGE